MHYIKRSTWSLLLFCVVFLVHAGAGIFMSADSRWSIHTAMSIVREGNADLNEYEPLLAEHNFYAIETIDGRQHTIFPIGVSILAAPFVFVLDTAIGPLFGIDVQQYIARTIPSRIEGVIASFVVAITAVVVFWIARLELDNTYAVSVALVFAFGTAAWSTGSRALWQHGPLMLCLALALHLLLRAREKPWLSQFASLPLACAYVVRPTSSIAIVVFTLYVVIMHRHYVWRYVAWSSVITFPFVLFNLHVYGQILSPYYLPQRVGNNDRFWEALVGNLISPARGLFVFTPIFIMSLPGMWLSLRQQQTRAIAVAVIGIIMLHWLVISSFDHWWGGHSFGSRLFSDMTPFFVYFLVPVFAMLQRRASRRFHELAWRVACLSLLSVAIHARGATQIDTWAWNYTPVEIDAQPSRVWDWRDLQFLRGID